MTGPIIPADEWPEDAALHTWDGLNGQGFWTVYDKDDSHWTIRASGIPMPEGWDWRVPVMRPHASAHAIDLERLVSLRNRLHAMACRIGTEWEAEAGELQRDVQHLIDGQSVSERPQKGRCPNNAVPGGCQLPNRFCTFPSCDKADELQPTKGEGE